MFSRPRIVLYPTVFWKQGRHRFIFITEPVFCGVTEVVHAGWMESASPLSAFHLQIFSFPRKTATAVNLVTRNNGLVVRRVFGFSNCVEVSFSYSVGRWRDGSTFSTVLSASLCGDRRVAKSYLSSKLKHVPVQHMKETGHFIPILLTVIQWLPPLWKKTTFIWVWLICLLGTLTSIRRLRFIEKIDSIP